MMIHTEIVSPTELKATLADILGCKNGHVTHQGNTAEVQGAIEGLKASKGRLICAFGMKKFTGT